jgi:hypothetical protein
MAWQQEANPFTMSLAASAAIARVEAVKRGWDGSIYHAHRESGEALPLAANQAAMPLALGS